MFYLVCPLLRRIWACLSACLSLCVSVCLSQNFNLGHNFCNIEDSNLIFGMHVYFMELHILSGERSRSSFKVKGKKNQSGALGGIVFLTNTSLVYLCCWFFFWQNKKLVRKWNHINKSTKLILRCPCWLCSLKQLDHKELRKLTRHIANWSLSLNINQMVTRICIMIKFQEFLNNPIHKIDGVNRRYGYVPNPTTLRVGNKINEQ